MRGGGLEEKECVFRCLNSCVKNVLDHGSQLFAKVQDPYIYLTVPPPTPAVVRFQTPESAPVRLAGWLSPKSEVHYC